VPPGQGAVYSAWVAWFRVAVVSKAEDDDFTDSDPGSLFEAFLFETDGFFGRFAKETFEHGRETGVQSTFEDGDFLWCSASSR